MLGLCFGGLFENEAHLGHILISWPPPPWTSVFQFSLFLYDALKNLDLLIKTGWSVICPLCC